MELDSDLLEDADDDIDVTGIGRPSLLAHDTANDCLEKGVTALVANHNVLVIWELEDLLLDSGLKDRLLLFVPECDSEDAAVEGLVPADADRPDQV